jgi:hypothetical protein
MLFVHQPGILDPFMVVKQVHDSVPVLSSVSHATYIKIVKFKFLKF